MTEFMQVEHADEVVTVTIERPETKNGMSHGMWESLRDTARAVEADPSAKVLVIRSGLERHFSAGADLREYRARVGDLEWGDLNRSLISDTCTVLRTLGKPVIVAVHGPCVGAGVGIVLAADLRVADETARFCIPPARLGLVFPFLETRALVELVGPGHAKHMLLTARFVGAEEALRIGLVEELVPAGGAAARAHALAVELTQLSQFSIRAGKRMVAKATAGLTAEDAESWRLPADALAGEDHREGMRALDEGRSPRFTVR